MQEFSSGGAPWPLEPQDAVGSGTPCASRRTPIVLKTCTPSRIRFDPASSLRRSVADASLDERNLKAGQSHSCSADGPGELPGTATSSPFSTAVTEA